MLNKSFLIVFTLTVFTLSQTKEYELYQIQFLYNEAKFGTVIKNGQSLLNSNYSFTDKELIEIHKYLALSFYNIAEEDSSRSHFFTILTLDSDFEPDPVRTSPKIISFFESVKQAYEDVSSQQVKLLPVKKYIFMEDKRPKAALRSAVFPGWGQFYKNQNTKGYIIGGAFWSSAILTTVFYGIERDLKSKYLDETDPTKVTDRYDSYNNMSKFRRFMQYTLISAWLVGIGDALFSEYSPQISAESDQITLSINIRF